MNNLMKTTLFIGGLISLCLGVIGLFLPILPTTPFLLLASFCFVRSSSRMHSWLHNHRIFGEFISNYTKYKAIPKRTKVQAILFLWVTLVISYVLVDSVHVRIFLGIVGVCVTIHLARIRTLNVENQMEQGVEKMGDEKGKLSVEREG